MADFFNWLVGSSTSSIIFIIIVLGLFLILIVAFIQGREISLWPPKIGGRLNNKAKWFQINKWTFDKRILSGSGGHHCPGTYPKPLSIVEDKNSQDKSNEISKVHIIVLDQVNLLVGSVQQRLRNAKSEVRISGNDNKFVAESASPWIKEALSRGVFVKVLCVDPESPATGMLAKIDPRFPTASAFVDSMESVEKELRRIKQEFPMYFEFRYLPILPAMGFFITDPTSSSGITKVEFYVSKPYKRLDSRPHIIIPHDLVEWREYFLAQWDNYWRMSKEPE